MDEKRKEYNKRRWAMHKEVLSEKNKQYYRANREKRIAQVMAWENDNREHVREKDREYYHKNAGKINARRRERYAAKKIANI